MRHILFILFFALIGCSTNQLSKHQTVGKTSLIKENDSAFTLILNQWDVLKRKHNVPNETDSLHVGFLDQENPDFNQFIALCYHYEDNSKEIRISKKYWLKLGRLQQKYILFRQLAICDLDIPLSYKTDPYGTPLSMMYFELIDPSILKKYWSHYEYSLLMDYK